MSFLQHLSLSDAPRPRALRAPKQEPIVFVLRLLYVDGYFVGFVRDGASWPARLTQHILGDACTVTSEFGVAAIEHIEPQPTPEAAFSRVDELRSSLEAHGYLAWGGSHMRHSKLAAYRPWLTRVADPEAGERRLLQLEVVSEGAERLSPRSGGNDA